MPVRLRQIPGEPSCGRAVFVDLRPGDAAAALPGQTVEVAFSTAPTPADGSPR
jgi:hypothetical protein